MYVLHKENTIVLNKGLSIPSAGIICAHPGRVKRIAHEFLKDSFLHTDYRGYQVYVGLYQGQRIFVANTGIGAPAAAFLIEELVSFGARKIIRVGSDDAPFEDYKIKLIERTTVPLGLAVEYGHYPSFNPVINAKMKNQILKISETLNISVHLTQNLHIDGYYVKNFGKVTTSIDFTSSDMESGALYLLGKQHQLDFATLLLSYPKHNGAREYEDQGKSLMLEDNAIHLALKALL